MFKIMVEASFLLFLGIRIVHCPLRKSGFIAKVRTQVDVQRSIKIALMDEHRIPEGKKAISLLHGMVVCIHDVLVSAERRY